MNYPLVTIIVPCYNHEKFVMDCLNSLINQTYKNIELLIVDDNSTDNSYRIISDYKERLEQRFVRTLIKKNPINKGLVYNLNSMIKISNGDYIKLIASDDFLLKDSVENMVKYALENQTADVFYSNAYLVGENSTYDNDGSYGFNKFFYNEKPLSGKNLTSELCAKSFICAPTAFIPKKTYDKYGLYDENYIFEDWSYWLKVSVTGEFSYLDYPTVCYRISTNSLSHFAGIEFFEKQNKFFDQKLFLLKQYRNYWTDNSIKDFLNDELNYAIGNSNIDLSKKILKIIRYYHCEISLKTKFKYLLLRIHIFGICRRIKFYLEKR